MNQYRFIISINVLLIGLTAILFQWQKSYQHPSGTLGVSNELIRDLPEGPDLKFVNIWATWCKPCLEEIRYLEAIKSAFDSTEINFIAITAEDSSTLRNFFDRTGITFTFHHLYSGSPLIRNLQNNAGIKDRRLPSSGIVYPTSFIIKNDKVVYHHIGQINDPDSIIQILEKHTIL